MMHEYLQSKINSERRIFEKLFTAILFTLGVFARNLLKVAKEIFFYISFRWRSVTWCLNPGFAFNKSTHYRLDHGDFGEFLHRISNLNDQLIFFSAYSSTKQIRTKQ